MGKYHITKFGMNFSFVRERSTKFFLVPLIQQGSGGRGPSILSCTSFWVVEFGPIN